MQRMVRLILSRQDSFQVVQQGGNGQKELVSCGGVFQMPPKTFNRVQSWTIGWQPEDQQAMLEQAQSGLNSATAMVGGVVQHQNHATARIASEQQVFQKFNKRLTVFHRYYRVADLLSSPVQRPYHMMKRLWAGSSRQALLLAAPHPTFTQRGVQVHRRFIHKDECKIPVFGVFFNPSKTVAASSRAAAS